MIALPRVLILRRLLRPLVALAVCGMVIALLATYPPVDGRQPTSSEHSPEATARELQRAVSPETRLAHRALADLLLSGRKR
jgi:hypothetical protein